MLLLLLLLLSLGTTPLVWAAGYVPMLDRRPGTTEALLPFDKTIARSRTFDDHLRVESETVNGSTIAFGYDNDGVLHTAGALTITRDPVHAMVTGTTLASGSHTITDWLVLTPFGEPDLYTVFRNGVQIFQCRRQSNPRTLC